MEESTQTESQDLSHDLSGHIDGEQHEQQKESAPEKRYLPEDQLDSVYKVTIDGEEREMTIREIARLQSLEQASQNRFRQAAEANKKMEEFIQASKKDPESALRRLGYSDEQIEEFSAAKIKRIIEDAQLSPEQIKEREERSKFQEEKKEWETQVETRIREEIDTEMTQAFQQSGLPKSPFLAARMAGLVAQSLEKSKNGDSKPLSYTEAAVKVKSWFQNATKETLSQMDAKAILDFLGPEMAKKLQGAFVQRIEGGTVPSASSQGSAPKAVPNAKAKQQTKFTNWKDYHKFIDSL